MTPALNRTRDEAILFTMDERAAAGVAVYPEGAYDSIIARLSAIPASDEAEWLDCVMAELQQFETCK